MAMGATLFYRRLASPLHATRATVAAMWACALIAATLLSESPMVLGALLIGVLGAGAGAGLGRELARTLRTVSIVAIPIVLVNVLVYHEGLTVFARLGDLGPFGQGDLTLEALVYGAVIALKVGLLMLVTTLAGLAIDPDGLLAVFRRHSFRSALTASLATRMIGVLSADSQRLAEAQRTRPGGSATGARARVRLLSAIVGSSLDRSMDVAATLELRGFAAGRHTGNRAPRRAFSRHDRAFAISAVFMFALALFGRLAGAAPFNAYPLLSMPVSAATLALCVALPVAVLLPFADRRGIEF
ncbi:MAG TPA: energy-coupling factor transporter transmembrane component T [Solirubrobacteraceae bacterium]|jgi:energy-coupling factor transport system permease protein|nr:energy-coupling factor transporter transmembrane component T [Solirubrobacteraceae bacterium]